MQSAPILAFLQIEDEIKKKERAREYLAQKYAGQTGLTEVGGNMSSVSAITWKVHVNPLVFYFWVPVCILLKQLLKNTRLPLCKDM